MSSASSANDSSEFDRDAYQRQVREQLNGLSREALVAIAARAAWRSIPLMFIGWSDDERRNGWWGKYGNAITIKLLLAMTGGDSRHVTRAAAEAASLASTESIAFVTAAVVEAAYPKEYMQLFSAACTSFTAAAFAACYAYADAYPAPQLTAAYVAAAPDYVAGAAAAAAAAAAGRGIFGLELRSLVMMETGRDIEIARAGGAPLILIPLWSSSHDEFLVHWRSAVEESMGSVDGAKTLFGWLMASAHVHPPLEEMRRWFNEWWLIHPQNTERTPAFANLSRRSKFSPNEAGQAARVLRKPARKPIRVPRELLKPAPKNPVKKRQEIILPKKKYLPPNYSVALASDLAAQQLTDTAEMYKEALRAFLACPDTQAPITVSVEAPWGAGKTSFLHCLRGALESQNLIPTVWFNPWKHEAGKTLWAAFAVAYERQMAEKLSWLGLWRRRLTLSWKRLSGKEQVLLLARLALWVLGLGALLWLWCHGMDLMTKHDAKEGTGLNTELAKKLPLLGVPLLLWGLLKDVMSSFGSPLKLDMVSVFTRNQHQEGVDDLHRFHEDFERLMCSYTPGSGPLERFMTDLRSQTDPHWVVQWRTFGRVFLLWGCRRARRLFYTHCIRAPKKLREPERQRWSQDRVVVFIDDLDRCEAPKAAEVLQSLHLMLSGGGHERRKEEPAPPGVICILGMDREKVAAAVAAKHQKLLPMLLIPEKDGKLAQHQALGFGHEFLEKFIQITVHLPGLAGKDQDQFLRMITGWKGAETGTGDVPATAASQSPGPTSPMAAPAASPPGPSSAPVHLPPMLTAVEKGVEARRVQEAVQEVDTHLHDGQAAFICASYVADALEHNPRRLKQFVNLFRLRLYLAAAMNLLDVATLDSAEQKRLQPDKLSAHDIAKLVALELCCPQTMSNLREGATIALKQRVQQEHKDPRLVAIIKMIDFKPYGGDGLTSAYDLGKAPVEKYFQLFVSAALPPESSPAE